MPKPPTPAEPARFDEKRAIMQKQAIGAVQTADKADVGQHDDVKSAPVLFPVRVRDANLKKHDKVQSLLGTRKCRYVRLFCLQNSRAWSEGLRPVVMPKNSSSRASVEGSGLMHGPDLSITLAAPATPSHMRGGRVELTPLKMTD